MMDEVWDLASQEFGVPFGAWWVYLYVRSGLNSHYFHIIGDGHHPNNRVLYTNYKDSY